MRSAVIGVSGARARAHADAYRDISDAALVAVSARTPDAAAAFAKAYPGALAFTDHRSMLDAARPDVVHVNTPPSARLSILRDCEDAGVGAVLIEKPIAIDWPDLAALRSFARTTSMLVAVNHQLQFHRSMARLWEFTQQSADRTWEVDASAGMNAAYQGTHMMNAARTVVAADVTSVTATASGPGGLTRTTAAHVAPDDLDARYATGSGTIRLRCGPSAPRVSDPRAVAVYLHKRIAVAAGDDAFEWTMWSWSSRVGGHVESERLDWETEDALGQAALTRSILDGEPGRPHPLDLERSLDECALILDAYESICVPHEGSPGSAPVLPRLEWALSEDLRGGGRRG